MCAGHESVRLKRIATGQLVLPATVNGVKGIFVLDTGSGNTIIDVLKKDKFKITEADICPTTETAVGAGASGIALELATVRTFSAARRRMRNVMVFLMDMSNVNNEFTAAGMRNIDGILGSDILFAHNAVIDYGSMTLKMNK